eukprot:259901_1
MSSPEYLKSRALIDGEKTNKEANKLFKQRKYRAAIEKYTSVTQSLVSHIPSGCHPDSPLTDHENLLVKAMSNSAQCYINLGDYQSARFDATSAAMFSKRTHVKSLYRAAVCFEKEGDNPSALQFINEVTQLCPNNIAALKLKARLESKPLPRCAPLINERIRSVVNGKLECGMVESSAFQSDLNDFRKHITEIKYGSDGLVVFDDKQKCNTYFRSVAGDRYTVKWDHNGTFKEDRFKLYDISSVWMHKDEGCSCVLGEGGGPADYGFCTVHESRTHDKQPGFDSNLFWTVMIFWKYCGTTFVENWDKQMDALSTKYMQRS